MKAQNTAKADSHVAVAGKVKVDLQQECERIEPDEEHACFLRLLAGGGKRTELIGEQHLFAKAGHKAPRAVRCARETVGAI